MSDHKAAEIALLDEFIVFQDTSDKLQILRLKRKIQKFIKSTDTDNTQLQDIIRILDLWIEDNEYNDFEQSFRIAAPIAQRLAYTEKLDFYDISMFVHVVGYGKDYKATHDFAQKLLTALKEYKDCKSHLGVKLVICLNVLFRLTRAMYFELNGSSTSAEIDELTEIFEKYVNLAVELCGDHKELWAHKTMALLRKAIFEKDYTAIDAYLTLVSKKGSLAMYKIVSEEINGYNVFAGNNITKMQLNLQVGKNIRKIRKSRYLTVEDLAKMMGITYASLQAIEQGKITATIYNLNKIAGIFELTIDEVVRGKVKPIKKDEELPAELQGLMNIAKKLTKSEILALNKVARQFAQN